jgi:hypothetical protein
MPSLDRILRNVALVAMLAASTFAQQTQQTTISAARPEPGELARRAVDNEIKAAKDESARFTFRSTKTTPKGSVTRIYIETKQATAGMTIAYDGKPLTPEQRQAELARIKRFIKNPEELEKKHRQEQQDAERTMRIVRAIPDAFLFEYAGEQLGSPGVGKLGDPLVVLKFRPNPKYEPPSRIEQVLSGMQGIVLVDAAQDRLASIDGTLFKEVAFGWGILGHLDKGGHFLVQQQEIADNYWAISTMDLSFSGRILLVKGFALRSTEVFSDFKPVPLGLTFAQAIDMLEKQEVVFAENPSAGRITSR